MTRLVALLSALYIAAVLVSGAETIRFAIARAMQ
jgi:hypothetical protein